MGNIGQSKDYISKIIYPQNNSDLQRLSKQCTLRTAKVFLCGKLGKPASLQAIFSIFYGSGENTKTEDFFGRGGGGGCRRSTDQAIY